MKRDNMTGRRGGESRSDSGSSAALLIRLRRLERVVMWVVGRTHTPDDIREVLLDKIEEDLLVSPVRAGSSDQRDEALLSLQRSPAGEASGEDGADG